MPCPRGSRTKTTTPANTTKGGQQKFPRRTHNARPRPSLSKSSSSSRQSTFTQMEDWTAATPNEGSRAEVVTISSDHEPDSDFEEPQPKKKRRVARDGSEMPRLRSSTSKSRSKLPDKAEADQHTVTQLWRMPTGSSKLADEVEDDDDNPGFNIHADDGRDKYTSTIGEKQTERRRKLPWLRQDDAPADNNAYQHSLVQERRYDLRSPAKAVDPPVRLSPYQIASRDFHTPKKSRLREIPSSQTPDSAKLSARRSQRLQARSPNQRSPLREKQLRSSPFKKVVAQRSPLKEKSANVPSARWNPGSPESQNPTMKMLERVRMIKMGKIPVDESQFPSSPVHPEGNEAMANENIAAELSPIPNEVNEDNENEHDGVQNSVAQPEPPIVLPRTLKRTATVHDSQTDGMPHHTQLPPPHKLKRTKTVQDSQMDDLISAPATRELKRTATVQDSQYEDLDLSSETYRSVSGSSRLPRQADQDDGHDDENDEDYEDYEGTATYDQGPYTYDPVAAALDRDAARFGWTQTQTAPSRVANSVADSEDNDDDDLDQGIEPPSDNEVEVLMLPQPIAGASQELGEDSDPPVVASDEPLPAAPQAAPDTDANVPSEQEVPSESPPSSPPTLRPSQVSTIVPTQLSPRQPTQRVKFEEEEYSPPTSPPAPMAAEEEAPASPPAKATAQSHARPRLLTRTQELQFSSSPLPFPPWSSPERRRWAVLESQSIKHRESDMGKAREALDDLTDFSLPPPPPLMSSSAPRSE